MKEYHKIDTVFKRDPETGHKRLLMWDYAKPEFEYLANNEWVFTEKVDGTNIRIMIGGGEISYGGRTDNAQMPVKLVNALDAIFDPLVERLNLQFPNGACLYGEGYGPGIQSVGGKYRSDQSFVLFDVLVGEWWLDRPTVEEIAEQFDMRCVPVIGRGTVADMVRMARDGITSTWGEFMAEGIVARPATELRGRNGSRIITKIKTRDFER